MKKLIWLSTLCIAANLYAQELTLNWTFDTSDKVLAGPMIQNGTIFIGDQKGVFYSIDLTSGKENWRLETGGNIQAKATMIDNQVFFESANVFYLVNAKNGNKIWSFDPEMDPFVFKYQDREWPYKIDPFDDKRSVATYTDGIIYVGSGDGNVYGLNIKSGQVEKKYTAIENAPVRSSPFIQNGHLYFGDWEGLVYCYSLTSNELIWQKKTYRGDKPYGTFGGIVSEFLPYDGLLFFGARNYMLNVLDINSGEKEWTYTDVRKGWIIGDPVIFNDTLYIGGSDNYSMLAFDPKIGRPIWSQNGGKNIYTRPVVTEDWVIYTAGNGYNPADPGALFLLNRQTGAVIDIYEVPKGTFSSPTLVEDLLVFGCYDSKIYCLKVE